MSERQVTRQAEVTTPLNLETQTANGRIRIHGADVTTASVTATIVLRHGDPSDDDVERVTRGIRFDGNRLYVESPDRRGHLWREGLRVDYVIEVPRESRVDLHCANGPVDLRNVEGPVEMNVANGPLIVQDVAATVQVRVVNGPASLMRCGAAVEAEVVNGPLRLSEIAGPLELKAVNGPIQMDKAGGSIEASTVNGPVQFTGPIGGDLELRSRNGGVTLRLPADSRFELDAEAERGNVHSDFQVNERGSGGPGRSHKLHLRTRRGNIHLQREGNESRNNDRDDYDDVSGIRVSARAWVYED